MIITLETASIGARGRMTCSASIIISPFCIVSLAAPRAPGALPLVSQDESPTLRPGIMKHIRRPIETRHIQ